MENIEEYIKNKKWRYKTVSSNNGPQFLIERCPFCFDITGTHFYIAAQTGQYYCHHCGAAGSFFNLKKHLGDIIEPISFGSLVPKEKIIIDEKELENVRKAHLWLLQDKDVLLYLSSRCITLEAVKYFKLGLSDENNIKWLLFPYISNGELKNIKMRTLPPAKKGFKRLLGGESSLYNEDILQKKLDCVMVCEGETDLLTLWSKGFKNVIATSIGAGGIKNEWIEQLDKIPIIYICYDNDEAGQTGAQKLASRLGIEKCKQIRLPIKYNDINEYFQKHKNSSNFQQLIDRAIPFDVTSVKSLGNVIKDTVRKLSSGIPEDKLILPWKNVDKLLNGFMPGDLIIIGAKVGVGKSSLGFNLLYNYSIQGIPSLLFSLEMPPWRILPRIVALHKRKDSRLCSDADILLSAYEELKDVPFYLAYKYDKPNWDFISDTIRHCVKRYGIRFVVFDNLHFLCRSLSHATEEISVMIQSFKLLAEELMIPIIVIARPRKTTSRIIDEEDLKGSIDVAGDADIILLLSRDKKKSVSGEATEGVFEPQCLVTAAKVRYAAGGSTFLFVNDAECRFEEM